MSCVNALLYSRRKLNRTCRARRGCLSVSLLSSGLEQDQHNIIHADPSLPLLAARSPAGSSTLPWYSIVKACAMTRLHAAPSEAILQPSQACSQQQQPGRKEDEGKVSFQPASHELEPTSLSGRLKKVQHDSAMQHTIRRDEHAWKALGAITPRMSHITHFLRHLQTVKLRGHHQRLQLITSTR